MDFTSALYLGLEHASDDLPRWDRLTLGKPAALETVPESGAIEEDLAALIGCERALPATSTLHLFWDLFAVLARRRINIFLDNGSYPIVRWGVERAACLGVPVRRFRRHDPQALKAALENADEKRSPVIVADGYCTDCGELAPIREYAALATARGGLVIIDDSQALGIFGAPAPWAPYGIGGGGSMQRACLNSDHGIVVGSSLAKAFGAPLAVFAGNAAVVNEFEHHSATRMFCSPPSVAVIAAAARALRINRTCGDAIRLRLAQLVARFRRGLSRMDLAGSPNLFPVQTLRLPVHIEAEELHEALRRRGVQAALHRAGDSKEARISLVVTARHSFREIDCALGHLAEIVANGTNRSSKGVMQHGLP